MGPWHAWALDRRHVQNEGTSWGMETMQRWSCLHGSHHIQAMPRPAMPRPAMPKQVARPGSEVEARLTLRVKIGLDDEVVVAPGSHEIVDRNLCLICYWGAENCNSIPIPVQNVAVSLLKPSAW